jgi:DUF4097 and DUF4098 domain-containing protein YvlB
MITTVAARAAVIAATLSLGAGVLAAQNTLDTAFTVRSGARLQVSNMSGNITVRPWNRAQIRVQAEYDRARVEVDVSPTRLSVRTVSRRGDSEVEYTISVPAGTAVELNGISTDIDITGVCGPATVNTVSGDVVMTCGEGDISLQSVSGDVSVSDIRNATLEATSTSGDVDVRNVRGPVIARSVSGEITLASIDGNDVSAETVSGEISYIGRIADGGKYRFEAHSGDVSVRGTNQFNATITASTFSGDFEPDFPITINPGRRSSREWEFTVGNGSARMTLRSFSGTIYLRRGAGGAGSEREEGK